MIAPPPLAGLSSMATRRLLGELAECFQRTGGCAVAIEAVGGVEAARRVRAGDRFDLVVLAETVMMRLEAEGHLVPGSRVGVARSGMAVAVPEGRPRTGIADEAGVRQAIHEANTIGYSTGPSGDHLLSLLDRWQIAASVMGKLLQAPAGVPVAAMLARGEADLGFQQLSEMIDAPGIAVLGPLPPPIQLVTTFAAAVGHGSARVDDVAAFLDFATSGHAIAIKRRFGMEPPT